MKKDPLLKILILLTFLILNRAVMNQNAINHLIKMSSGYNLNGLWLISKNITSWWIIIIKG